jgi:hypothetical protein
MVRSCRSNINVTNGSNIHEIRSAVHSGCRFESAQVIPARRRFWAVLCAFAGVADAVAERVLSKLFNA